MQHMMKMIWMKNLEFCKKNILYYFFFSSCVLYCVSLKKKNIEEKMNEYLSCS
jgi:hypothetical protein